MYFQVFSSWKSNMATDSSHKKRTPEKMWEAQQPAAPRILDEG